MDRAIALRRDALELQERLGDRMRFSIGLANLGVAYHETGRSTEAVSAYREAARLAAELGDASSSVAARFNHAALLHEIGRLSEAEALMAQAATRAIALRRDAKRFRLAEAVLAGVWVGEYHLIRALQGELAAVHGDRDRADTLTAEAIDALRARGEVRLLAESLAARARALGDRAAATEAWTLADQLGYLPTAPLRRQIPDHLTGVTKPG